jgi:hypothetical protein
MTVPPNNGLETRTMEGPSRVAAAAIYFSPRFLADDK